MKHLNDIEGFNWACFPSKEFLESRGMPVDAGFARAAVCHETFWICQCQVDEDGTVAGYVDNDMLRSSDHGLEVDDMVSFTPVEEPEEPDRAVLFV